MGTQVVVELLLPIYQDKRLKLLSLGRNYLFHNTLQWSHGPNSSTITNRKLSIITNIQK